MLRPTAFAASSLLAAVLLACNGNPASEDSGKSTGGGDFDVAPGALYADTALTPGLVPDYQVIAPNNGDTIGFSVTGRLMRYRIGDSSAGTIGFVEVSVGGGRAPVNGTYPVMSYLGGAPADIAGKAKLYVYGVPGGMSWSDADSSGSAKVKVVVTADSVQVLGKEIKLSNGKKLSFNLTAPKPDRFK